MSRSVTLSCFRCGAAVELADRVGRRDTCPECDADLHCCLNCRHYSPGAHNDCNEPQADWVREKERANFCDWFEPGRPGASGAGQRDRRGDARARFEDLFKK